MKWRHDERRSQLSSLHPQRCIFYLFFLCVLFYLCRGSARSCKCRTPSTCASPDRLHLLRVCFSARRNRGTLPVSESLWLSLTLSAVPCSCLFPRLFLFLLVFFEIHITISKSDCLSKHRATRKSFFLIYLKFPRLRLYSIGFDRLVD